MNTLKAGLAVFTLVVGTAVMAQGRGEGKSPQEKAQFRTDWMAKELSLTEEQKTKVAGLNLQSVEQNQAIRKNESLTAEQKKEAWQKNRQEQKAALKNILTKEQLAVLKTKKAEFHKNHKGGKSGDRSAHRADRMAKELSLTPEQQTRLSEMHKKSAAQREVIRKDDSKTAEQKEEAMKSVRESEKKEMEQILTAEQLATLKAKKEAFKSKHKEGKHPRQICPQKPEEKK